MSATLLSAPSRYTDSKLVVYINNYRVHTTRLRLCSCLPLATVVTVMIDLDRSKSLKYHDISLKWWPQGIKIMIISWYFDPKTGLRWALLDWKYRYYIDLDAPGGIKMMIFHHLRQPGQGSGWRWLIITLMPGHQG